MIIYIIILTNKYIYCSEYLPISTVTHSIKRLIILKNYVKFIEAKC